ncbi:MAG: hypothetical protein DCC71_12970 [Proteobacteria bacterium]|nr:MAG: hypothetical protein DCC71_12970 [Pseudomonadota bacterium]
MKSRASRAGRSWIAAALLACAPALVAPSCWFRDLDAYRGWTGMQLAATGRFRVEQVDGVWWLVTPDGHPFFSAGVNNVSWCTDWAAALDTCPYRDAVQAKYGSPEAWSDAVLARMEQWGLNTIGAWSEIARFRGRFPYTQILALASGAPEIAGTAAPPLGGPLRDFFDPAFAAGAAAGAASARECADDPWCIGVYSDNELPWGPHFRQRLPFVDAYLKLPAGAPGKRALQAFFEARWAGDLAAFNAAWRTSLADWDELQDLDALPVDFSADTPPTRADRMAFRGHVAERYFRVAHDALRAVSPDLLILGACFLAYGTGPDTAAAAAPWVDVVSVNPYEWNEAWTAAAVNSTRLNGLFPAGALLDDVDAMYAVAGKPILITEFGYRAEDAGLPNSWPPIYPTLPDQPARADAYEGYLDRVLARPWIVGAHWFEWADQPASGRFDGEDNNWGLVTIDDEPYPELLLRMWSVHHSMYARRAALATP